MSNSQDPDARYNTFFASKSADLTGRANNGLFQKSGQWTGTSVYKVEFANGTDLEVDVSVRWSAQGLVPFNCTDRATLFDELCLPKPKSGSQDDDEDEDDPKIATPLPSPPSYPEPVLRDPYNLITGYYLNDSDVSDVAVLAVLTFELSGQLGDGVLPEDTTANFSKLAADFLAKATADGKKKMLIDLSGNGGGDIAVGFNLFRIFFPNVPVYTATRFRAHELVDLMGQAFVDIYPEDSPDKASALAFRQAVTPNQTTGFASWEDLYGPHELMGVNVSSLVANFNFTLLSNPLDPVNGYGPVPLDPKKSAFKPEDIIIVRPPHLSIYREL